MEASDHFSNKKFYGKTSLSWKVRLERKEKEFQKHTIPLSYRPVFALYRLQCMLHRLDGPPADWQCFYRQEEAFSYSKKRAETLHVFAYESSTFVEQHGQRLYLVASYPQFWHYYSQLPVTKRHHYEVIPNGSVCRLYFDLEFPITKNSGKDGVKMTQAFIKFICGWLMKCFNISCSSSSVLQLEASTSEKFSRHLIFNLPSAVFHDNIQAGHFVQHCTSTIWKLCSNSRSTTTSKETEDTNLSKRVKLDKSSKLPATMSDEDLQTWGLETQEVLDFIVKDKHDKDTLFCDTGVYTKNRNFRLYKSCKLGKQNPLVLAKENQYKPDVPDKKLDQQIFLDSLVTSIKFSSDTRVLTFEADQADKRCFDSAQRKGSLSEDSLHGHQRSPYPELDMFITAQVQHGGVNGFIRRWAYFPHAEVMMYDIGRNRWCHNIGRPHKSNNVMMIADLKASVFYQKCHDPECKAQDYKSPEMPIPKSVLPSHHLDDDLTDEEDELCDEDLLSAASLMEQSIEEDASYHTVIKMNKDVAEDHNKRTKNCNSKVTEARDSAAAESDSVEALGCDEVGHEAVGCDEVGDEELCLATEQAETSLL